ncbi:MAG: sialidase family protein [Synergistaceae bacterium]
MPQITDKYKIEYFKRGSLYSALSDFRRFTTLDYNLESYVGIVGVGIISGWTIEQSDGLRIQILPGKGIIQGQAVESPYAFKRRSEMNIPEREVEVVVVDPSGTPERDLTASERAHYVAVVQAYDPSYDPEGPIENSYIKAVTPYSLQLFDDNDNYIYARRPSGRTPYPPLSDYPPDPGDPPSVNDYDNYNDYLVAKAAYDAARKAIADYEWRISPSNHFTAVEFTHSPTEAPSASKILLGKVIARGGSVLEIDLRGVDSLENMHSRIEEFAKYYLSAHRHGGSGEFDPPKVKLETDIRPAVFSSQLTENKVLFQALSSNRTSIVNNHQHSYVIDENGDGYTVGMYGTSEQHFHKIETWAVLTNEYTTFNVEDHVHVISQEEYSEWTTENKFKVYINGKEIGDETTITSNPLNGTFEVDNIIGSTYKTYSTTFDVPVDGEIVTYSYSKRSPSVLRFMLEMEIDFENEIGNKIAVVGEELQYGIHPFLFQGETEGSIAGFDDLRDQSIIAEQYLKNIGDKFTFTPKAASNITIFLIDVAYASVVNEVKIEILGNTEVTGTLGSEHILYINASKILLGEFEPERIPFIDHIGRMKEECLPFQQYIVSKNGIEFSVVPSSTLTTLNHSHKAYTSTSLNGVTTQTFIGEDPAYYGTGLDGITTYLIAHRHGIVSGNVSEAESDGLMAWQSDLQGANVDSSAHTHELVIPLSGDPKTVYSIIENKNGHLYVGTSNGFYMIPNEDSYLYVINEEKFYLLGSDLWDMLIEAKTKYEKLTKIPLSITEEVYGKQIAIAETVLSSEGSSYLMQGVTSPSLPADQIMIQRLAAFQIPNFVYYVNKYPEEVESNDIISGVELRSASTGELITDYSVVTSDNISDVVISYIVMKFFESTPIWSSVIRDDFSPDPTGTPDGDPTGVAIEDLCICGSGVIAKYRDLEKDFYNSWRGPFISSCVSGLRKIIKDAGNNFWIPTNQGLLVSRPYQNLDVVNYVVIPGFSKDVKDVASINGIVFCTAGNSIYKTLDEGGIWTEAFSYSGGFKQLAIDEFDGICIYAVAEDRTVFKSEDEGVSWREITNIPDGETSEVFIFNEKLFISKIDGLYLLKNSYWDRVLDEIVYSFGTSYDHSKAYFGCHNSIYSSSNGEDFSIVYSFSGNPLSSYLDEGIKKRFGYAYSSASNSLHFKQFTYIPDSTHASALVNCDMWLASEGPWKDNSNYEIFIDSKIVLSTLTGVDKRGDGYDYFTVDPTTGIINFGAKTDLKSEVSVYDSAVEVESTDGFNIGDRVVIKNTTKQEDIPDFQAQLSVSSDISKNIEEYVKKIEEYGVRGVKLKDMYTYATITAISGNFIYLDKRFNQVIDMPAYVRKIPMIESSNEIRISIYDPMMRNIGENTHEQIEDSLSIHSDLRPYQLNNAYLSNILQLTQAIRYVYPDINYNQKNSLYYDFNYDESELEDIVDIPQTDLYSQTVFDSGYLQKESKSINSLLLGTGTFTGFLFASTDIGIFSSKISDGMEGNWFYIGAIRMPVFDLIIINDDTLYAATSAGIYYSKDLINWTFEDNASTAYPIQKFSLRWSGRETVGIPSHTAVFSNDDYDTPTKGYITVSSSLYGQIKAERVIRVNGAGDLNGIYFVLNASAQQITIDKGFDGLESIESKNNVEILQASWWEQFDGEDFTGDADIKNTLLAGGNDRLSYKVGDGAWNESTFPKDNTRFSITDIIPLNNGTILASSRSSKNIGIENYVFKSTDIGSEWATLFELQEISGNVISSSPDKFGNTVLIVEFTNPEDYKYPRGNLDLLSIFVFSESVSDEAIAQGYIVWNEFANGLNKITVFGQDIHNAYIERSDSITFKIYPVTAQVMAENEYNEVFFGTDSGLYTDQKTIEGGRLVYGDISEVGKQGTVGGIDLQASIISISRNVSSGNVQFSLKSEQSVSVSELVGQKIYIIDADPVEQYVILSNTVKSVEDEFVIEINKEYQTSFSLYAGKKTVIASQNSKIYVNFDSVVSNGDFDGGKIYVYSDENNNIGLSYDIIRSTTNMILISTSIIPSSTSLSEPPEEGGSLISGQKIIAIDKTGRIPVCVGYSAYVEENQLADKNFITSTLAGLAGENGVPIYSNDGDKIILKPFNLSEVSPVNISIGDQFNVSGEGMSPVSSFNSKKTSVESAHYHDLELIGITITGDVDSLSIASKGVTIAIDNVENWNAILDLENTLLEGARIRFYNPNIIGISFYSTVKTISYSEMVIERISAGMWDSSGYNKSRISATWRWEIDSKLYGYTANTYYNDFVVDQQAILSDVVRGEDNLVVESSTNMAIGDKIEITDGFGTFEINYISGIVDANNINIRNSTKSSFFVGENARVKVLRDTFSNNHVHKVQGNEVEKIIVEDYNNKGYPSSHSHRCLPFLLSVNQLLLRDDGLIAMGSSSKIYKGSKDGSNWSILTDLNSVIEGGEEVDGVSSGILYGQDIIAGTTNGFIYSDLQTISVIELEKPTV